MGKQITDIYQTGKLRGVNGGEYVFSCSIEMKFGSVNGKDVSDKVYHCGAEATHEIYFVDNDTKEETHVFACDNHAKEIILNANASMIEIKKSPFV